jgi:hypothetical protein
VCDSLLLFPEMKVLVVFPRQQLDVFQPCDEAGQIATIIGKWFSSSYTSCCSRAGVLISSSCSAIALAAQFHL